MSREGNAEDQEGRSENREENAQSHTRRRVLLGVTAGALAAGTHIRGGTERRASQETPTETPGGEETPTETPRESRSETVDVGEQAGGETLALVVRNVDRRTLFDAGGVGSVPATSIVSVELVVKNEDDAPIDVSSVPPPRIVDSQGNSYTPGAALSDGSFPPGQLVPGEVQRETVVYAIPATATELRFEVVLRPFDRFEFDRVTVDLDDEADRLEDLGQALRVPVARIGETVPAGDVEVTLSGRLVTPAVGGERADRSSEFVVPTVAVTNGTPDPLALPVETVARVKDDAGRSFLVDEAACDGLEDPLAGEPPIPAGATRRGRLPYEVPDDGRGLYWTFDFSVLDVGDKAFWRLR